MKQFLSLIIMTLFFSSCTKMVSLTYGLKGHKNLDNNKIIALNKKYNIPLEDSYIIDSAYFQEVANWDTIQYKQAIHDHLQPLQALYFNQQGKLVSFHANCYTGGIPNLKWNRNDVFNVFPANSQAPLDTMLSLEQMKSFIDILPDSHPLSNGLYDYTIIVLWSNFMGRQSKRLINQIQSNVSLSKEKVKILYVLMDAQNNFYGDNIP